MADLRLTKNCFINVAINMCLDQTQGVAIFKHIILFTKYVNPFQILIKNQLKKQQVKDHW